MSEAGIASGVRRIEALTGLGALAHLRDQEHTLRRAAALLKSAVNEVPDRVERLLEERRAAERKLEQAQAAQRGATSSDLTRDAALVGDVRVLSARVDGVAGKQLREMVDELRGRLKSGVVLLVSESEGKLSLALGVTKDLTGRFRAGDLMRDLAGIVGGKGGGRPDFAQGGGDEPDKLEEAFERLEALIAEG